MNLTPNRADRCVLTRHARETAAVRGVTREAIVATLASPEVTRTSGDCLIASRGALSVVTCEGRHGDLLVITVLLRAYNRWDDEDCRRMFSKKEVA